MVDVVSRGAVAPVGAVQAPELDTEALDRAVADVAANVSRWAATDARQRARLLDAVLVDTLGAADAWLADACEAKGFDVGSPESGEELFSGVGTFVRMARLLRDSLDDIAATGRPAYPGPVTEAPDGRLVVGVFPSSLYDRVVYPGTTAEIWMQPGVERAALEAGQAEAYVDPGAHQGVALVLGAGNVASLGPRDVLSELFVEGKVVVLKANPVNDYLVPHWGRAMRARVDAGVLRIVAGGAAAGAYLTRHPQVDEIHITGSDKTYNAIVFGTGDEGERRRAAGQRLLDKPVTAELGNVSPVIVVPGEWSRADLLYQAENVATMLANNAGFNCLSIRVLVTHEGWPQRQAFLGALEAALAAIPTRRAYYPGAVQREQAFLADHPDAELLGSPGEGELPWTLVRDVAPGRVDDICFNVEAFCSLFSETALAAPDAASFLDEAVRFCNEVVWGTLSATVLVHPRSLRAQPVADSLERAVADLRYGGIGVNVWHALVFAISSTTWGAYPGHPDTDIQSGAGVVGNAAMFSGTQKSVVRGPFRSRPKPAWFATNTNTYPVMRQLLDFEAKPRPSALAKLLAASLKG